MIGTGAISHKHAQAYKNIGFELAVCTDIYEAAGRRFAEQWGCEFVPTYEAVCSGSTGHVEVVQVTFDPQIITFREILEILFVIHDPTTLNRQGNDRGTQYRSVIFYHSPEQKETAEALIADLTAQKVFSDPIVTAIEPLSERRLERRHDPRKRLLTRTNREVNVVGHEAVGEKLEVKLLAVAFDPVEILLTIAIIVKDRSLVVSARGHVIDGSGILNTKRPRHETVSTLQIVNCQPKI